MARVYTSVPGTDGHPTQWCRKRCVCATIGSPSTGIPFFLQAIHEQETSSQWLFWYAFGVKYGVFYSVTIHSLCRFIKKISTYFISLKRQNAQIELSWCLSHVQHHHYHHPSLFHWQSWLGTSPAPLNCFASLYLTMFFFTTKLMVAFE